MEPKEFKQILLESFNHSKDTREYFYLKKAKESGCPDHIFFESLMRAYNELERYLNSKVFIDEGQYIENGPWEKMYEKKTIEISNGKLQWTLTDEDLPALLPALLSMGKTILSETVLNEYQKKIISETSAKASTGTPAPKQVIKFDAEILKNIILSDHINTFIEYEQRLVVNNYFNEQGKFIKKKNELVIFIMMLENNGYFKKNKRNSKRYTFVDYRKFFENRYNINIAQESKPFKRAKINLTGSFTFITQAG